MNYYDILLAKKLEDDRDPKVEGLSVTANGTYSEEGKVYKPVVVNVAGYSLEDMPSGAISSFTDGTDTPLNKLEVGIEPIQSGSGDPSPENVRPISGWGECKPSVAGKNLVNWKWNTFNDGKMEIFLKGGTYTLSAESTLSNGNAYICGTKPSGEYVSREELGLTDWGVSSTSGVYYGGGGQQTYTFNIPNGGAKIEFGKLNNNGTISAQLEFGSTATPYEPYNGSTITIPLGDTYYGGKLDVVNGVLTVEWLKDVHTWGDYSAETILGDYARRRLTINTNIKDDTAMCSVAPWNKVYSLDTNHFYVQNGDTNSAIWMYLPQNTSSDFSIEVRYELATPTTIQLTPTQVRSLLGNNNIFADTGNIIEGQYFKTL